MGISYGCMEGVEISEVMAFENMFRCSPPLEEITQEELSHRWSTIHTSFREHIKTAKS